MTEIFNCGVQGINLPLMITVEYMGYRLTCMSTIPIGSNTLVYGSSNAGINIYYSNPEFNQKMEEIGKKLNLSAIDRGGVKYFQSFIF